MARVLGIVGSPSTPSKTRSAVATAVDAADREGVETDLVHLGTYDLETADGRGIDAYEGDTGRVLQRIVDADAYIVGTPVYRGALPGPLKNLLDLVPRGLWQGDVAPLEDAAVGLVATGATHHHYLSIDHELRPIFGFFGAHTVGGSVYATDDHFDDDKTVADAEIRSRLATLGSATVDLHYAIEGSDTLDDLGPQF